MLRDSSTAQRQIEFLGLKLKIQIKVKGNKRVKIPYL
jgi:hypothetical protein